MTGRWFGRHLLLLATLIAFTGAVVSLAARNWVASVFFTVAAVIGGSAVHVADRAFREEFRSPRKRRLM